MEIHAAEPGEADRRDIPASVWEPSRFRPVFERHVTAVHRYLVRRVGGSLAEDLVGETFAIAFRQREDYDPRRATGRSWLLGIATNLARRHQRSEARRLAAYQRVGVPDVDEPSDGVVNQLGDSARVDAVLARIDPDLRDVILLIGGAGLTYEEASTALKIPLGTVRSRMSRARQAFRTALADVDTEYDRRVPPSSQLRATTRSSGRRDR